MRDNTADYYESFEFQQILQKFEDMIDNGSTLYLDASDIADIVDYYVLSSEQEKVETALEYGMRLHPNDTDIAYVRAGFEVFYRIERNVRPFHPARLIRIHVHKGM